MVPMIGIPSPPAIMFDDGRVVTPDIRDAEPLPYNPVAHAVNQSGRAQSLLHNIMFHVFSYHSLCMKIINDGYWAKANCLHELYSLSKWNLAFCKCTPHDDARP